ncbi:hypothetical protein ACM1RC_27475 [Paenibacillus azoreducens]|uniref:hypothetical protein n=1 Tax=Paenibacillus azoreducens TaxID=116718 RepID=UPI0039F4ECAC
MKPKNQFRHQTYFYWKHGCDIRSVSRKTKKCIIGTKMSKRKLKERLAAVTVTQNKYPEPATLSDEFCPKCGCDATRHTANMAPYPEVWIQAFCARCGFLVGMADNSPWQYALEFPEYNYELD